MKQDIIERLGIDPGRRTLGELLQDREAALYEIRRLRAQLESLRAIPPKKESKKELSTDAAAQQLTPAPRILLKLTEVCELLSVSRSTVYKKMSDGTLPEPVQIGERAMRWRFEDIEAWCDGLSR